MIHLIPDTHIVTETSDDGLLVVDIEHARYVFLDSVGARMWQALRQTGDLDAAAAVLHQFYDVEQAELEADVSEFAEYLVRSGFASYEPWARAIPAEIPLLPSRTAEGLYLDLLTDILLGDDASTARPAEAHLVRLVRDLTSEAAKAEIEDEAGAIVLPESLGHPAAWMAAGVLAAHERWSWRIHVIPEDVIPEDVIPEDDGLRPPPQFAELGARVRLDPLCLWGWPNNDDRKARVPALVWLPNLADASSGWAALAEEVTEGGIVAADDVNTSAVQDLRDRHGQQFDDITPLSWRAGWWRVEGRAQGDFRPQNVDSAAGAS